MISDSRPPPQSDIGSGTGFNTDRWIYEHSSYSCPGHFSKDHGPVRQVNHKRESENQTESDLSMRASGGGGLKFFFRSLTALRSIYSIWPLTLRNSCSAKELSSFHKSGSILRRNVFFLLAISKYRWNAAKQCNT